MSSKHRATDYAILIALGALLLGAVLLLVSYGWLQDEAQREDWRRTTHSPGRYGLMAFYRLSDRLGYDVRRVDHPLLDDTLDEVDVLVVIDPLMPVNSDESAALVRWMESGGVLVCAGGEPELPAEVHRIGDPDATPWFGPWSPGFADRPRPLAGRPGQPLGRDVKTVHLLTGETLHLDAEGDKPPADVLFKDSAGVRVAARPFGAGRAIRAADYSFLVNRALGQEDNAILGINLLAWAVDHARGDRVGFDEYHCGFGPRETGWSVLGSALVATPPGWALLALTAAAGLYLVYRGRRFGTRRPPPPPHRRSKLEYVHSVGATYRAVGAHVLTLRLVYAWLKRRAARRAGADPSMPAEEIARRLAPHAPEKARRYADTFAACEAAAGAGRISGRRLAALLAQLTRIESETLHGHPRGE